MKNKEKREVNDKKENLKENEVKESKVDPKDLKIISLEEEVLSLKQELNDFKKKHEKQIFEFIDKKSKEASKIISEKEKELSEKYKSEFESKKKYIHERQLSDLSTIVSQFEDVINSVSNPEVANYLVGFKMFLSKFHDLFDSFGIVPITPKVNDEFDSEVMEATNVSITDKQNMHNKISKVFSKGYKLHDRVIKLASVEVIKFE